MPCKNGATCSDKMTMFRCKCTDGFSGIDCGDGKWFTPTVWARLSRFFTLIDISNLPSEAQCDSFGWYTFRSELVFNICSRAKFVNQFSNPFVRLRKK